MAARRAPAIGIDLGTYTSTVGVFRNGKVEILANEQGNRSTASWVAFTETQRLVGDAAKNQGALNPRNTIFSAQRLVGRKFEDSCVQDDMKLWPFEVVHDDGGRPKALAEYKGEKRTFFPEEISSMVLAKVKETAEAALGQTVSQAVITVPAYFSVTQRQAVRDAATVAGLSVLRLVSGSTAAAIAYGLEERKTEPRNVLVFDLGGGSTSVSILTIEDGFFEVKSTAGYTQLGGEDFDSRLINHFVEEFQTKFKKDPRSSKRALARLRTAVETAKRSLSSSTSSAAIEIDSLFEGIDYRASISRAQFEKLNADLFRRSLNPVIKALLDAGMGKETIDSILLVGGSSRIPRIQLLLQEFFNGKELVKSINPDEAAAVGASVLAAVMSGDRSGGPLLQDLLLLDAIPFSLGVEAAGGAMTPVIPRNSSIPTKETTTLRNMHRKTLGIYEGDRELTKDNVLLGRLDLSGILPPRPLRSPPQFEVTFDLGANAVLVVSARESSTGKEVSRTITPDHLAGAEIQRLITEAKKYKADEEKEGERLSAKNGLESYVFNLQSTAADKLKKDKKITSESAWSIVAVKCDQVIQWLDTNGLADKEEFEDKMMELARIYNLTMANLLYYPHAEAPSSSPPSPSSSPPAPNTSGGAGFGHQGGGEASQHSATTATPTGGPTIEQGVTGRENPLKEHFFECPVCLEIPSAEIYQCADGHTVCASCFSDLSLCPQCRAPYGGMRIRCRAMEALLDTVSYPCPNRQLGCAQTLKRGDKERHLENDCEFTEKRIPLCTILDFDCSFKVSKSKLEEAVAHFESHHQFLVVDSHVAEISHVWMDYVAKSPTVPVRWTPVIFRLKPNKSLGGTTPSGVAVVISNTCSCSTGGGKQERAFQTCCIVVPDASNNKDYYSLDVSFQIRDTTTTTSSVEVDVVEWKASMKDLGSLGVLQNLPHFTLPLNLIPNQYLTEGSQFLLRVMFQEKRSGGANVLELETISPSDPLETVYTLPTPTGNNALTNRAKCDACGASPLTPIRYKCLQCPDYDLCMSCMARKTHSGHVFAIQRSNEQTELLHNLTLGCTRAYLTGNSGGTNVAQELSNLRLVSSSKCTACLGPLVGIRYSCLICPTVDLCQGCFDAEIHSAHPFAVIINMSQELFVDSIQKSTGTSLVQSMES